MYHIIRYQIITKSEIILGSVNTYNEAQDLLIKSASENGKTFDQVDEGYYLVRKDDKIEERKKSKLQKDVGWIMSNIQTIESDELIAEYFIKEISPSIAEFSIDIHKDGFATLKELNTNNIKEINFDHAQIYIERLLQSKKLDDQQTDNFIIKIKPDGKAIIKNKNITEETDIEYLQFKLHHMQQNNDYNNISNSDKIKIISEDLEKKLAKINEIDTAIGYVKLLDFDRAHDHHQLFCICNALHNISDDLYDCYVEYCEKAGCELDYKCLWENKCSNYNIDDLRKWADDDSY